MGSLPQNARLGITRTPCTTSTSEAASDKYFVLLTAPYTLDKLQVSLDNFIIEAY